MDQPPLARRNYPNGYITRCLAGKKDFALYKVTLDSDDYTPSQHAEVGWKTFIYEIRTATGAEPTQVAQVSLVQDACESGIEHLRNRTSRFLGGVHVSFAWELEQESQITHGIVYQFLKPASEYISAHPETLPVMADQMLQCVHDLRYEAFVLHRDVSEGNIMYKMVDGEPYFILNDFDLAVRVNEDGSAKGNTSTHRTGTVPYMAADLLWNLEEARMAVARGEKPKGISHRLRFDYESVFWVSLGFGVKLLPADTGPDKTRKEQERYEEYLAALMEEGAWGKKRAVLQGSDVLVSLLKNLSEPFMHLEDWFDSFQSAFGKGYVALEAWRKDQKKLKRSGKVLREQTFAEKETHFGCVTLEKIRAAIDLVDDEE